MTYIQDRPWSVLATVFTPLVLVGCGESPSATDPPEPLEVDCDPVSISLTPGEAMRLPSADTLCVRFSDPSGDYAMAFADVQEIELARFSREERPFEPTSYEVGLHDLAKAPSRSGAWTVVAPTSPPRRPPDVRHLDADRTGEADDGFCHQDAPDDVLCESEPWQEGDRFELHHRNRTFPGLGDDLTVEVMVVRGLFVFAAPVASGIPTSRAMAGRMRRAADEVSATFVPLLESTLTPTRPKTTAAGQILVLVEDNPAAGRGVALSISNASGVRGMIILRRRVLDGTVHDMERTARLLGHELTHLWQGQYRFEGRGSPQAPMGATPHWASEGTATWTELEVTRRRLGYGLMENRCEGDGDGALDWYLDMLRRSTGQWHLGYFQAASFLHDLRVRTVRAGADEDAAFREVMRGALEGWHGVDELGGQQWDGLIARMRRVLDPEWDPGEALLVWAASVALDDRTENPTLQQPSVCRAWDAGLAGWRPLFEVTPGAVGGTRPFLRSPSSAAYGTVHPTAEDVHLVITRSIPDVRFLIARYR
ncbi:MAG: hypothetical protein ACOC5B_01815 [Myxococcota bacterium]